nr:Putative transposase [Methylocystis sp. SC2]
MRDIRRATRRDYSAEEKIRIVLDGLRGDHSIAELCRREVTPRACIPPGRKSSSKPASGVSGAAAKPRGKSIAQDT